MSCTLVSRTVSTCTSKTWEAPTWTLRADRCVPFGRIPVCGMISAYNNKGARSEGVTTLSNMIYNRVTMRGFVVYEFNHLRDKFLADMRRWMQEGRMKYTETIMEGIENAPSALIGLLQGQNTGKMLVRLADE